MLQWISVNGSGPAVFVYVRVTMSWAAEDWTSGLSGLVLKKVQDLQVHNEKLIRERQQRQLQLDNSEAALHKQNQKVCLHDSMHDIQNLYILVLDMLLEENNQRRAYYAEVDDFPI